MTVHELDISWAATAEERRHLRWELLACDEVDGVFLTAREDVLVVLFSGDRRGFHSWARTLEPDHFRGLEPPNLVLQPQTPRWKEH
jgi:hypothetical protein